jgi:hypothetical protein
MIMHGAQNLKTNSKTTISHSECYLIPGSYASLWHTNYRNEILQCHHYVLSALRYILFYTFIIDGFGKIHIFLEKGTHF